MASSYIVRSVNYSFACYLCRIDLSAFHLLIILDKMETIKKLIYTLNMTIVKILLMVVYYLIITPYRLFMKNPNSQWIIDDNTKFDIGKMW